MPLSSHARDNRFAPSLPRSLHPGARAVCRYSNAPTQQTVEVVSDARAGRSVVSALKGDFLTGKLASTGSVGVVEDFMFLEYDNQRQ